MFTQLPRVLSFIPSSFATTATGRDVSITIFTASSLNSGEKLLFFGRVKIIHLPRHILMDGCPESSGHLKALGKRVRSGWPPVAQSRELAAEWPPRSCWGRVWNRLPVKVPAG